MNNGVKRFKPMRFKGHGVSSNVGQRGLWDNQQRGAIWGQGAGPLQDEPEGEKRSAE